VVISLKRGVDCLHMVQLIPLHLKTPLSLASLKSILVLPFWYQPTQAVLEKRPLNGCSSSSSKIVIKKQAHQFKGTYIIVFCVHGRC